jgi:hypothetical protein
MDKNAVISPLRFRFTEQRDVEKYGSDWYVYDELNIITAPARVLIPLEREMEMAITDVMDGVRNSSVLGDTGAAWLAMYFAGKHTPWSEFNPCSMLLEWEANPEGKAAAGESDTPAPATDATDTVSLPTLPVGG